MQYKKNNHYLEITIDKNLANKTIQDIFIYYHLSKKTIHELRMSKDIYINDQPIFQNFNISLKIKDRFKFPFFIDEEIDFIPQNIPIDIIYEDEFILIINKQPNIEIHPDSKNGLETLVNGVAFYYQKTHQKHRIRYIHRLDRDTTGLIVFVKEQIVHNLFDYLLNKKIIKRYYLALVENKLPKSSETINVPIGRDRHHNQKRIVSKTGDKAITRYKLIKSYENYNLIELELYTGRTHQIRVHMAYINCPILGDKLYGEVSSFINRQALHAYKISLIHPITFKPFTIDCPIPSDFEKILKNT